MRQLRDCVKATDGCVADVISHPGSSKGIRYKYGSYPRKGGRIASEASDGDGEMMGDEIPFVGVIIPSLVDTDVLGV